MRRLIFITAAWLILGSAGSLFAQGVQTGTIRGQVKDQQDLAVPGVTVTGKVDFVPGGLPLLHKGTLRVSGPAALAGTLTFSNNSVSGKLGGRPVKATY